MSYDWLPRTKLKYLLDKIKNYMDTGLSKKAASDHTHNNYVPTSRTVNGKALSADITLSASDVGAAEAGHTHSYLPLAGGTLTGNVTMSKSGPTFTLKSTAVGLDKTASNGLTANTTIGNVQYYDKNSAWTGRVYNYGSSEGGIFTQLAARNMKTDGTYVSNYIQVNVNKAGAQTYSVANAENFRSAIGLSAAATRSITNLSAKGKVPYSSTNLVTVDTMAFWDGSYNDTHSSNLTYCNKGAFGSIVTKADSDYAAKSHSHSYVPLSGGTMTGNLNFYKNETGVLVGSTDKKYSCRLGVGSAGVNRGIWDFTLNKWMVYADASNVYLNGHANSDLALSGGKMTGAIDVNGIGKVWHTSDVLMLQTKNSVTSRGYDNQNTFTNMWAADFVKSSSKLVKTNIKPMTDDEASKILDLEVVGFDYIDAIGGQKNRTGLIAEDVLKILPDVVSVPDNYDEVETKENIKNEEIAKILTIDYSNLVPYLIKMIQIQRGEINHLKTFIQ